MASERPPAVAALYNGARRLAPGIYVTKAGDGLVNVTELLEAVNLPDTDENRHLANVVIRELYRSNGIHVFELGDPAGVAVATGRQAPHEHP